MKNYFIVTSIDLITNILNGVKIFSLDTLEDKVIRLEKIDRNVQIGDFIFFNDLGEIKFLINSKERPRVNIKSLYKSIKESDKYHYFNLITRDLYPLFSHLGKNSIIDKNTELTLNRLKEFLTLCKYYYKVTSPSIENNIIIRFSPETVNTKDMVDLLEALSVLYKSLGGDELIIKKSGEVYKPITTGGIYV